jgi:hypothetical protein
MGRDKEGAYYPAILRKHLRRMVDVGDMLVYLTSSRGTGGEDSPGNGAHAG